MNDQSGRLVNDEKIFVLEDNIETDGLRLAGHANLGLWNQDHQFSTDYRITRPHLALVDTDQPKLYPAL